MPEPFRRGKIWYGFVRENGKRRMRSTHCTDKAAAERVFRELQRAAADPDHARAQTGTVAAAVQVLLSIREEQATAGRRSTETVELHRKKSGHLVRILEGVPDDGTYIPHPRADCAARVALILATSACASESDHVLREDVDQETGRVLLRGTKRPTRWRTVPIVTSWQKSLLAYAVKFAGGTEGRLFGSWSNIRRDLIAASKAAKIDPCSPNDLRRTHSHWLRAEGVPLELVAPMMGHSSTRMVQTVYGKLSADELAAHLRRVIPGAPDCIAGASDQTDPAGLGGPPGRPQRRKNPGKGRGLSVPRDGIEPPTRGFSIHDRPLAKAA